MRDLKAQTPDHIAVTGDLVNISLDSEFAPRARSGSTRSARRRTSRSCPAITTPTCAACAGHAAQHWGDYMRGDDGATAFRSCAGAGRSRSIGLSTSVPTRPFMATGRLGGDQLARLAEILIALAREPVFRVVLIHHPPVRTPGHYMKRLIDAPIFRALLAEHGAELLLHGHNHEQQLMWLDGPHGPHSGGRRAVGLGDHRNA